MASSTVPTQPQHRLIGFGSNYFYALGGSSALNLSHGDEAVVGNEIEDPPWKRDDDGKVEELKQIACTTASTLFLTKSGQVYQVGMLHGQQWQKPTKLEVRLPIPVGEVAAGRHFCLARCGVAVVSWGAGHFGQLGHGPNVSVLEQPEVLSHLLPQSTGSPVVKIACGAWHACALTDSGKLFCWGSNRRYQCGSKTPPTLVYPNPVTECYQSSTNTYAGDSNGVRFSKLACGKSHTLALEKNTGKVYSWGASIACGHSSRKTCIAPPRLIEALQRVVIVDIAAGESHSLALTGGGRVFGWGSGLEGQLGMGPSSITPLVPRPKLVGDLDFVAIVAGHFKDPNGTSMSPKLLPMAAVMASSNHSPPQLSQLLPHIPKIVSIHASGSYSIAKSSTGHVYCWGYNDGGALGLQSPSQLPTMEYVAASSGRPACIVTKPSDGKPHQIDSSEESRLSDAATFDSRHNVLIPKRLDCLRSISVEMVTGGPNHMWVYGSTRDPDEPVVIGHTLYEHEQAQNSQQDEADIQSPAASTMGDVTVCDSMLSDTTETARTEATTPLSPTMLIQPSPRTPAKPRLGAIVNGKSEVPVRQTPPVAYSPPPVAKLPSPKRSTSRPLSPPRDLSPRRPAVESKAAPISPGETRRRLSVGGLMRKLVPKRGEKKKKTETHKTQPRMRRRVRSAFGK